MTCLCFWFRNCVYLFSSWSSVKQIPMQQMSMATPLSIMPASGATTWSLRLVYIALCWKKVFSVVCRKIFIFKFHWTERIASTKCFFFITYFTWSIISLAWICFQDLVSNAAQVSISNKYGETPLDKAKAPLAANLRGNKCHMVIRIITAKDLFYFTV